MSLWENHFHLSLISKTCNRATVKIDETRLMSIIKNVEKKTLDILLKLKKEFGTLDELKMKNYRNLIKV